MAVEPITLTFKITLLSMMILSGAVNTLTYKFQNQQYIY